MTLHQLADSGHPQDPHRYCICGAPWTRLHRALHTSKKPKPMNDIPPDLIAWGQQAETRVIASHKRRKSRQRKAWRCLWVGFATGAGFVTLLIAGIEALK